jgi:hypothetical protein
MPEPELDPPNTLAEAIDRAIANSQESTKRFWEESARALEITLRSKSPNQRFTVTLPTPGPDTWPRLIGSCIWGSREDFEHAMTSRHGEAWARPGKGEPRGHGKGKGL